MSIGWKKSLEGKPQPYELYHKVRIKATNEAKEKMPDPAYEQYGDKLALRSFFNRVKKKRKSVLNRGDIRIKFTVFLEPVPYLCVYNEGDEELTEFCPTFYESFRHARHVYITMLDVWYKQARKMRKASDLP